MAGGLLMASILTHFGLPAENKRKPQSAGQPFDNAVAKEIKGAVDGHYAT